MVTIENILGERVGRFIRESTGKIRQINRKYASPTIKLSGGAKFALLLLRVYLIFLVGLLAYKFYTLISGSA